MIRLALIELLKVWGLSAFLTIPGVYDLLINLLYVRKLSIVESSWKQSVVLLIKIF